MGTSVLTPYDARLRFLPGYRGRIHPTNCDILGFGTFFLQGNLPSDYFRLFARRLDTKQVLDGTTLM